MGHTAATSSLQWRGTRESIVNISTETRKTEGNIGRWKGSRDVRGRGWRQGWGGLHRQRDRDRSRVTTTGKVAKVMLMAKPLKQMVRVAKLLRQAQESLDGQGGRLMVEHA